MCGEANVAFNNLTKRTTPSLIIHQRRFTLTLEMLTIVGIYGFTILFQITLG
jgi:hypothetical protein